MLGELGISFGTAVIVLAALYFVVKWAVKKVIKEAYEDITEKDDDDEVDAGQINIELGFGEAEK